MKSLSILAVLTAMLHLPASAQELSPDLSFENSKARLVSEGYTDVRMRNGYPLNLSARDSEGREVFFTVDGATGAIGNPEYDYGVDS